MPQLSLTQRSNMANSALFQSRLIVAAKKSANYWETYAINEIAKANLAVQKRKVFATQVLKGHGITNILNYTQYFVSQYNEETPDLIDSVGQPEHGQLTDAALTDSFASANTFDYFAGVELGDETKPLDF